MYGLLSAIALFILAGLAGAAIGAGVAMFGASFGWLVLAGLTGGIVLWGTVE